MNFWYYEIKNDFQLPNEMRVFALSCSLSVVNSAAEEAQKTLGSMRNKCYNKIATFLPRTICIELKSNIMSKGLMVQVNETIKIGNKSR